MSEKLGEGHYGIVQRGESKENGKKVAIKTIKKSKMIKADYELIRRENSILKLVRHPNLVTLLDYFEDSENIYIIMELLDGGDVFSYLDKNKKVTEKNAAKIMRQVALGIRYMNCYGLIHRDLKPENLVFSKKDDISSLKIIDYGLAKTLGHKETAIDSIGTINYLAPEIFTRTPYGGKVDIWSMGVILYLLIAHRLPFDDPNEDQLAKQITFAQQEYPSDLFSGVSKGCIDLIDKCLEKKPNKRISIEDFLQDDWLKRNCVN